MDQQCSTATNGDDDVSRGAHPPQEKAKLMRNKRPCGRCSKSQRKCDVEPPYSAAICRQCARAGLAECPPYEPRKKASAADRASRSSPTSQDGMSSHDGSVYDGPALEHSRQHSGDYTDAVFLMHPRPTQVTQSLAAPLTEYRPACPIPPLSGGYIQPSSSLYNWESHAGWKESVPTDPNAMPNDNVPMTRQGQPIPFHGLWGEIPGGEYNDSATYQTAPARYTYDPNVLEYLSRIKE